MMTNESELLHWLRLMYASGVGNKAARALLATFGLPEAIFCQSRAALETVVTSAQAQALLAAPAEALKQLSHCLTWLDADPTTRRVVTLGDFIYPEAFLTLPDPPLVLWVMGRIDLLTTQKAYPAGLSMVGSRNPSPNGARTAHEFAAAFAASGLCVVSGLALGIDAAAHSGALDACAKDEHIICTLAVVGTGLDRVYPKQNRELAHRIATKGLILSEFPLATPPIAANFPKRNRLIAALGLGTLVVEAALQSGSLITARESLDLGRDVFAIPGSIHQPQSKGCHQLIKQGAKLVECAEDVLQELSIPLITNSVSIPKQETPQASPHPLLTNAQTLANEGESSLLALMGFDPVSADVLQIRSGLDAAALQVALLSLELAGHVSRQAGGLYQRHQS